VSGEHNIKIITWQQKAATLLYRTTAFPQSQNGNMPHGEEENYPCTHGEVLIPEMAKAASWRISNHCGEIMLMMVSLSLLR